MALTLEPAAFQLNGNIPRKHTCEGADVSPPLAWSGEPGATKMRSSERFRQLSPLGAARHRGAPENGGAFVTFLSKQWHDAVKRDANEPTASSAAATSFPE